MPVNYKLAAPGIEYIINHSESRLLLLESQCLDVVSQIEATAAILKSGWIYTGDLANRDADGFYWLVDRKKDMIISGGENIYSKEVEDILSLHSDIIEVAVVGLGDEKWGEVPLAIVDVKRSIPLDEL